MLACNHSTYPQGRTTTQYVSAQTYDTPEYCTGYQCSCPSVWHSNQWVYYCNQRWVYWHHSHWYYYPYYMHPRYVPVHPIPVHPAQTHPVQTAKELHRPTHVTLPAKTQIRRDFNQVNRHNSRFRATKQPKTVRQNQYRPVQPRQQPKKASTARYRKVK